MKMLYIFPFLEKFPQYLVLTISKYGLESSGVTDSTGFHWTPYVVHMKYQGDRQELCSESAQNLVRLGSGLLIRTGQNFIKKIGSNTAISGQKNSEWILIRSAQIWWVSGKTSTFLPTLEEADLKPYEDELIDTPVEVCGTRGTSGQLSG